MHAGASGHNRCNHRGSNVASISRLIDSINKRALLLLSPLFAVSSFGSTNKILT